MGLGEVGWDWAQSLCPTPVSAPESRNDLRLYYLREISIRERFLTLYLHIQCIEAELAVVGESPRLSMIRHNILQGCHAYIFYKENISYT